VNLRPYQLAVLAALQDNWRACDGAALLDMATANGKAVRCRHAVNPSLRSLIAVHVSELDHVTEIQARRDGQYWRINRRHVQRADGTLFDVDHGYRFSRVAA
jgi:hypothetical protein